MVAAKAFFRALLVGLSAAMVLAGLPSAAAPRANVTSPAGVLGDDFELISMNSNGAPAPGSSVVAISGDGRFVLFASTADNLPGPDVDYAQLYVRDRQAGTTSLVSRNSAGTALSAGATGAAISADGRYVMFNSAAANLRGPEGEWNIYRRDRSAGTTTLVSQTTGGEPMGGVSGWGSLSADGARAVFSSGDGVQLRDIEKRRSWLLDASDETGLPVGSENSAPGIPHISGSGRFVVYEHAAEEPFGGGGTPCPFCAYVYDHKSRTTRLVDSAIGSGNDWPEDTAISGNGRIVNSHDYSRSYMTDLTTVMTTPFDRPSPTWTVEMGSERLSRTGRFVAFSAFDGSDQAVFVHDRLRTTDHVLVDVDALTPGFCERPEISGNGAWIAMTCSLDDGGTHVYVAHRTANA